MRSKNGFIATSVLYAFLIAFLTLFLGFMSAYIQNKQLINRIEEMAKDDLEKYGNTRISDMEIGDYVIFDTIDNVSNGITHEAQFSSPIDPNTKWILFKIDKTSDEKNDLYYFASASDAQKTEPIVTAIYNDDGTTYPKNIENIPKSIQNSNLSTVSKIINGNVYYNSTSQLFRSFDSSVDSISKDGFTKVYSYQFMYFLNGGIDVNFMTNEDIQSMKSVGHSKIENALFNQNGSFTIWGSEDATGNEGFYTLNYHKMSDDDNKSESQINTYCKSSIGYQHEIAKKGFETYYDYCYYTNDELYLGKCTGSSSSKCDSSSRKIRFVATIKVSKVDESTNGYADSGNGTSSLPYLITRGAK